MNEEEYLRRSLVVLFAVFAELFMWFFLGERRH